MNEPREEEEREHETESDATQTTATTESGKSQKKRGRKKKSLDALNDRITKQEERFTSFESKMDQVLMALGSPGAGRVTKRYMGALWVRLERSTTITVRARSGIPLSVGTVFPSWLPILRGGGRPS